MAEKKGSKIIGIANFPTVIDDIHESSFRSYQVLKMMLEMMGRGDSQETIMETVSFLGQFPPKRMEKNDFIDKTTKVLDETELDIEQPEFEKESNMKGKKDVKKTSDAENKDSND